MTGLILLYPGLFIFFQLLFFVGGGILLALSDQVELMGIHIHIATIFSAVVSLIFYSLIYRKKGKRLFRLLSVFKIPDGKPALLAPAGVALSVLSVYFFILFQKLDLFESSLMGYYELLEQLLEGNLLILILSVGLIVPLVEEVIFRELVFNELRKNMSVHGALIIQAVLFGIFHMQVVQGIFAVLTGILLGLVYIWLKTIWAPIILHSFVNISSIVITRFVNEEVFSGASAVIIFSTSLIFVIFVFMNIYKNSRHKGTWNQVPMT
jgi:uncharacterized protein